MDYNLFEGSMDECKTLLKNEDEWNKLPILNSSSSHLLSDGQIVRFQGMIQDMSNPVLSITEYEIKNKTTGQTEIRSQRSSGYIHIADDEEVLFDSDKTISKETKVYYCITVPGLNEWVEEYNTTQQHDIVKKLKEQCTTKSLSTNLESKNKRSLDESSNVNEIKENMDCSESLVGVSKRLCVRVGVTDSKVASSEAARNCKLRFPIENSKGIVCVLNVYTEDCDLKLNEIVDVAGFLSFVPSLESECNEAEEGPSCLPLIPHLNAITVKTLKHSNPLVPPSDNIDEILQNAENIRAELNSVLKKILFGDGLAADYLICHLLSTVFNRMSGLVLGKFSLNISNIPTDCDYAKHLYSFLTNLVPKSHYLPLTIKNLNTMTFIPKKDYEKNSLESGLLQLSNRTFLVLDETKLEPGNLEDKGVRNVRALSNIINRQVIGYNFQYYPLDFTTDIPVLILSEGKSMLPSDYHIALDYNDSHSAEFVKELFNEATRFIKNSNLINDLRIYLSVMASLAYKFTADLEAQIAEDFVRMRQSIGQVSAQDLHDLLVLARLFSVSRGSTSLSIQTWEIVQEMEQQRKSRLNR